MNKTAMLLILWLMAIAGCQPAPTPTLVPKPISTATQTAAPAPSLTPTAAPTQTGTPTATPTLAPTRTPEPTATAIPTIPPELLKSSPPAGVPNPKDAAAGQLETALSQVANTLGLKKENLQLSYCALKDTQGNAMVYAVANYAAVDDPPNSRHWLPLLVARQTQTKEWQWNRVGFRILGDSANLQIGVMMDTTVEYLLDDEFNFGLFTSGWGESTQPQSADSIQFNHEDYHVGLAQKHGIFDGRIMHLIFGHRSIPSWIQKGVGDGSIDRNKLIDLMRNYIRTMVTRYSSQGLSQFVAVNEPFHPGDIYSQVIGPEYIEIAFQAARDANPNAILLVNETDNHRAAGSAQTKNVLERLKKQGLDMGKIAVGVQAHIWQNKYTPPPDEDDVVRTLQSYKQTYGVDVYITEMDVNMKLFTGSTEARFKAQAEIYRDFIRAALKSGVVKGIGFWTPIDQTSWYVYPQLDPDGSPDSVAGLWEGKPTNPANPGIYPYDVWPKPSYYAVLEELFRYLLQKNNIILAPV